MELLSKALSAMKPSKVRPVDERSNPHRIETMAGQENEADEIAQCVGQRQNFSRHAAFGTADGLALRPLLRPVRGDGL
jgi:hypothetical protein